MNIKKYYVYSLLIFLFSPITFLKVCHSIYLIKRLLFLNKIEKICEEEQKIVNYFKIFGVSFFLLILCLFLISLSVPLAEFNFQNDIINCIDNMKKIKLIVEEYNQNNNDKINELNDDVWEKLLRKEYVFRRLNCEKNGKYKLNYNYEVECSKHGSISEALLANKKNESSFFLKMWMCYVFLETIINIICTIVKRILFFRMIFPKN